MLTISILTNIVAFIACLLMAGWLLLRKTEGNRALTLRRRFMSFFFVTLAAFKASVLTIVHHEGIEIIPTQALAVLSFAFIVLTMGGCAAMRRNHWRTPANWGMLLFVPVLLFFVNILMMASGSYRPLYSMQDIIDYRVNAPIIFAGRLLFLGFLMLSWLLALAMLIEAFIYGRWLFASRPADDTGLRRSDFIIIGSWAVLIHATFVPLCISHLLPHIIYNVVLLAMLWYTARTYRRIFLLADAQREGRIGRILIGQRLPKLLDMEEGGVTPWGVTIEANPFFSGNSCTGDVAAAMGVSEADITAYIMDHDTNLLAWVSEQRLLHSAQQIAEGDRKINEIALACGYNDLPTFSRAFKRHFGMTPSEYRKQSKNKIQHTENKKQSKN